MRRICSARLYAFCLTLSCPKFLFPRSAALENLTPCPPFAQPTGPSKLDTTRSRASATAPIFSHEEALNNLVCRASVSSRTEFVVAVQSWHKCRILTTVVGLSLAPGAEALMNRQAWFNLNGASVYPFSDLPSSDTLRCALSRRMPCRMPLKTRDAMRRAGQHT